MQDNLHTGVHQISERLRAARRRASWAAAASGSWARHALRDARVRSALIVITIALLLLGILVPPLRVVASLNQDYTQLKALGESGLHHLLAAKATLAPLSASTTALKGLQTEAAALPACALFPCGTASVGHGVYNGCDVHPSPSMASQGIGGARTSRRSSIRTPS